MAKLTKGHTFDTGNTVTATKLNDLVDEATVAYTTAGDTDDSTLEVSGNKFRVKDGGITATKLATGAALPAGAIMPFAMNSAPSGWLKANGDAVPNGSGTVQGVTADFSALYTAVGTSFGTAGTLPDLRGIFVRGSESQTISGTTYSGTFAAKEQDAFKSHTHTFEDTNYSNSAPGGGGGGRDLGGTLTKTTDATGDTETHPANIALLYCIKH